MLRNQMWRFFPKNWHFTNSLRLQPLQLVSGSNFLYTTAPFSFVYITHHVLLTSGKPVQRKKKAAVKYRFFTLNHVSYAYATVLSVHVPRLVYYKYPVFISKLPQNFASLVSFDTCALIMLHHKHILNVLP